jgi:hypothetical protein
MKKSLFLEVYDFEICLSLYNNGVPSFLPKLTVRTKDFYYFNVFKAWGKKWIIQ